MNNSEREKQEVAVIDEATIQDKIYVIRGQKVMLDVDLAEIYGYETKAFNQQVKNNIEKFDEDFMFLLTKDEWENLRSKKLTSSWGGSRYMPRVFTEQGIYMLMTVLKGELAIKQSKALIRTFKKMKDFIIENQKLIGDREYLQLSMQVSDNLYETVKLRSDLREIEEQIAGFVDDLSDVVTHSELSAVMNEFGEPHIKRGYLVLNGQPFKADLAYNDICAYVKITVFSDNLAKGLRQKIYEDFRKEYPGLGISLFKSGGIFHDRYIILDYDTENERILHCGASSKDAGERITSILEDPDTIKYHSLVDELLKNDKLQLS